MYVVFCYQVKLEVPEFELSDDMTANLANEELIAQVEEVCTVWNRQIMDALDGLLKKTPEGKCADGCYVIHMASSAFYDNTRLELNYWIMH